MPFTFAHPGFTLPIKKWKPQYFSVTGLFFGSIAPDMDILLRLSNPRFHIFQYDLFCIVMYIFPIALLFSVYFHLVMRNVFIDHLPVVFYTRVSGYKNFNYLLYLKKNWFIVSLSVFAGIFLHLFLDLISHFDAGIFKVYGGIMFLSRATAEFYYYMVLYGPALLLTGIGFYLMWNAFHLQLADFKQAKTEIFSDKKKALFYILLAFAACIIAIIKTAISGIDKELFFDNIIINLTNGCLVSAVLVPSFYFALNKIKN